jgi:DNA repair protein RadC
MNVKLTAPQKKAELSHPGKVAPIMQQILMRENKLGRSQEHFWIVGLNNVNKILFIELISLGRQNRVHVNPPDVFRMAIYKLALKAILVHNHPSDNLKPSTADINITDRLTKVGEMINIDVVDHLIISETGYLSFLEEGLMKLIKESDSWRVLEKEQIQMKEVQRQIELERAQEAVRKELARKLRAEGMDDMRIKELTGLKLSVINKLK